PNQLKLGCRRNYEGSVLCVCDSNFCNAEAAAKIATLPVASCLNGMFQEFDHSLDTTAPCSSNFCLYDRLASIDGSSANSVRYYCQKEGNNGGSVLARFDMVVNFFPFYFPAGVCLKVFWGGVYEREFCSCPSIQNCSTPTKSPGLSGLPLDARNTALVKCVVKTTNTFDSCDGHVCFVVQRHGYSEEYGCITYDERFIERKLPLGAHKMLDTKLFLCNTKMCNLRKDPNEVFDGLPPFDVLTRNLSHSCNCLMPATTISASSPPSITNMTPILAITITIAL
ncbi:hypothetical protein PMAYCL1PPCAC_15573, partial [Pristionchus mayeri]